MDLLREHGQSEGRNKSVSTLEHQKSRSHNTYSLYIEPTLDKLRGFVFEKQNHIILNQVQQLKGNKAKFLYFHSVGQSGYFTIELLNDQLMNDESIRTLIAQRLLLETDCPSYLPQLYKHEGSE